jgi:isoleucyl-tRNA synthetase
MIDFKKVEEEASKRVTKEEIKKAVGDDKARKKMFSFLEGPPTANAPPGLHHLEVRTFKDIINKFRYMQGYNVPRKAGWDCHGLPVEVQIEKKLKLNSKKDILKYGEAKFIKECRESVFSFIKDWDKSTERMGYWIDLDKPYKTLDNEYIESVWWSLKELYKKKLLYEDNKVVPFCPRCETPLSSHEVAQGYKKIKEESVVVGMKVKDKYNEYLLVWTTTPWTLPANLGVAVNPDIEYAYVFSEDNTYILAKDLVEKYFDRPVIMKTVKGKELIGVNYEPLFNYFKGKGAFRVIAGDFVTVEDGTGLVHMAPAFGEVDYEAGKANKLPFFQPVDETGKFTDEVPDYKGRFIKDADKDIIKRLREEKKLFKTFHYEHDYPFCWRCDSPLMYYAIKSWFIKVTAYKKRLIELNKKINWVPEHVKEGRFGEWLNNVKDWALSRNKFWGTPLPIWRCECGAEEIIGSVEELKKKAVGKINGKEIDLHKPWIDNVHIKCTKCKKDMARVPEVIDCWYDSGAATFAQFHYPFENKEYFEKKRFPYDFIAEAVDQTRGWFYTLHVLTTILFDDIAYKNVICAGHIVDEKGEKMSKSKGNVLDPNKVLDEIGVDATRLQFCIFDIAGAKRFGVNTAKQDVMPFLDFLWNSYQYYKQLKNEDKAELRIEDKWILSRLNSLIANVTGDLEEYQIDRAIRKIMGFATNDVSKTYIKIIRERTDKGVNEVMKKVIENTVRLLAPYAPNITEVIYEDFDKKSVHLSDWPKADKNKIDEKLEKEFENMLKVIEAGLAARDEAKVGLKWPLTKAKISADFALGKELEDIVMKQLNVKKVEIKKAKELGVELDTKMTPELEAEGFAREFARKIQAERKNAGLKKGDLINLRVSCDKNLREMLHRNIHFLSERTNSSKIEFVDGKLPGKTIDFSIKDRKISAIFS